jgi:hypothetical protein
VAKKGWVSKHYLSDKIAKILRYFGSLAKKIFKKNQCIDTVLSAGKGVIYFDFENPPIWFPGSKRVVRDRWSCHDRLYGVLKGWREVIKVESSGQMIISFQMMNIRASP